MDSLQSICILCSKLNEIAFDLECMLFCDPAIISSDMTNFTKNGLIIVHLYKTLYDDILIQNDVFTFSVTLYAQVLLKVLFNKMLKIEMAITQYLIDGDKLKYFNTVLTLNECLLHKDICITFNKKINMIVKLNTLNDIENMLCKINSIYGLLSPSNGLQICREILDFMGIMCGSCVVAPPETYYEYKTCIECYKELTMMPNQGHSIKRRLQGKMCNHLTVSKEIDNIEQHINTIEKDIKFEIGEISGLDEIIRQIKGIFTLNNTNEIIYLSEVEDTLKKYNLFSIIPDAIYSLSDFTYWSKASENVVKTMTITMQQLNICHTLYRNLQDRLNEFLYGECSVDIFTINEKYLNNEERLYIGSPFISPGRIIDMITTASIKNLENNPLFIRLTSDDEIHTRIKSIMDDLQLESQSHKHERTVLDTTMKYNTTNIQKEVNIRKKAYFQKMSEIGYNKIIACINEQKTLINKIVNINVFGSVLYDSLSKIMNGFISRKRYENIPTIDLDISAQYDDHLYIKNNLIQKKLPIEILPDLTQAMYQLLNGPLFNCNNADFPLPTNICMAYSCDVANFLPHMKEDLVKCVEGTIHPNIWMSCEFGKFFYFDEIDDLNEMQKKLWNCIREIVLSVALYNDTFGKQLKIHRIDDSECFDDGLIITYNIDKPLYLWINSLLYTSKDLYLLLSRHLHGEKVISYNDKEINCLKRKNSTSLTNLLSLCREEYNGHEIVPSCLING